jgi:predicted enzyme related to lactoylglutathione lyase
MFRRLMCGLVAAVLVTGCAGRLPEVPSLSDSGTWKPGKVVWRDLVTPNLGQAKTFYGGLFGWTFEDASKNYTLIRNGDRLIGGMAELASSDRSAYWLPLVSVRDVDWAVDVTVSAGGESLTKPFDVPGRGRVGVLADPGGAPFAVIKTTQGDPADRIPGINEWMWQEIWTDDVEAEAEFYARLAGYTLTTKDVYGSAYSYLSVDELPRVGVITKSDPEIHNTWVNYVRVADLDATVAKVAQLGGVVLMAPTAEVRDGNVAIIADPQGAGLVLQEIKR